MQNQRGFRENCFDVLRYLATFGVMTGHYVWKYHTFGTKQSDLFNAIGEISVFFPGVIVLFAMSGYLVAASVERSSGRSEYLRKRVLRMYPELWGCTIISLIVLLVVYKNNLDNSIFIWLGTQVFGISYTPSCLKNFATGSVNGSLWTVFTEIQLYIILWFCYKNLKRFSKGKWILFLFLCILGNLFADMIPEDNGMLSECFSRTFIPYAIWFFEGVFCYVTKEKTLPVLKRIFVPLLGVYIFSYIFTSKIPGYYANIGQSITLPFIVIAAAYILPEIHIKIDLTYGIFLYHWPVMNLLIHYNIMKNQQWFIGYLLFLLCTVCISYLSKKTIGKLLSLKTRRIFT